MRAMVLERPGEPVRPATLPDPTPDPGQLLLKVAACAVCRTDLHLRDAEIEAPKLPVVLGHQIVGRTEYGTRYGVPWLGWTDGTCRYCQTGRENLCVSARFTGRDSGGLIGYRAYRMTGDPERIGLYGFGSAAHQICQVAVHHGREVYAFTRSGDNRTQEFARSLGATWAGGSDEPPPNELDAAIIFASAGELVPAALKALAPGGVVVCAGIHMSDIPSFPYEDLWHERTIRSVANLTRQDGHEFLELAPQVPVHSTITTYPLADAEQALADLRAGAFVGTAVLVP
jgi:propanol-preferring alcohol dehydrogenase